MGVHWSPLPHTNHLPPPTPTEKEKIQELQVQRALAELDVSKDQNWCCGVTLSRGWIIKPCCTCSSSEGLSPAPSQGYEPHAGTQRVGCPEIKSTILAAQVRYLDTDRFQPLPQLQSNFQILSSFSQDVYCKDKERKEKRKKHNHKHTTIKTELKNLRMLLKTTSKVVPQHVGKCLAPAHQSVTLGKRLSMAANPTVTHQGMEPPLSKREVPTVPLQLDTDLVRGGWNETIPGAP